MRLLFNEPTFTKQLADKKLREFYIPRLQRERGLHGNPLTICAKDELESHQLAEEFAKWLEKKCEVRSLKPDSGALPASITLGEHTAYMGVKALDEPTLGLKPSQDNYQIIEFDKIPTNFKEDFEQAWGDSLRSEDVKKQLIASLKQAYEEHSPEFIYYFILSHLYSEQLKEDKQPAEVRGFKDSAIWGMLFEFQRVAVLGIISKLETYNGCILADSVGLGKTFTALGVIKYYEQMGQRVLVLCPKKLSNNWTQYNSNVEGNIFEEKFSYDVLAHTDLSRSKGKSGAIDLEQLRWGNYGLVVIDESHNFRNGGSGNSKMNRYDRLMEKVIRQGANTKVLMLSATPVNNSFKDLKNQLALAYAGEAERLEQAMGGEIEIDALFKEVTKAYKLWSNQEAEMRTKATLLKCLPDKLFTLIDAVTIARSRRHITELYDASAIGSFPDKLEPKSYSPDIQDSQYVAGGGKSSYEHITEELLELNYSVYRPLSYVRPDARGKYIERSEQGSEQQFGKHSQAREYGLCKLMATGMLKRLESSASSFCETVSKLLSNIQTRIDALDAYEAGRQATVEPEDEVIELLVGMEECEEVDQNNQEIDLADIERETWRAALEADRTRLEALRASMSTISGAGDHKLQTLIDLIIGKHQNPINEGNHKVLVFTAYADTANYLYDYLAQTKPSGMQIGLVTGQTTQSTINDVGDMEKILSCFSPRSKRRDQLYPRFADKDIDILIATDCISEGQNLQDCDYVVNYDIHWNPVRIIQRFGRVDRIGSQNKQIQLVNFWPAGDLDQYINLRQRVESRMTALIVSSTGEDNPMEYDEEEMSSEQDYRANQLKALKEQVTELEDIHDGVSIMDFGQGNYRDELIEFAERVKDLDKIPNGLHAVVPRGELEPGVIYCLRNQHEELKAKSHNRQYPYYLLYVTEGGEVQIKAMEHRRMLETLRKLCKGQKKPVRERQLFEAETKGGSDMSRYADLLQAGVASIVESHGEQGVRALLRGELTDFTGAELYASLDQFELIAFLILK